MRFRLANKGFTLIEILIALIIFSIIATLCASGLWTVLHTEKILHQQSKQFRELQIAIQLLQSDTEQLFNRKIVSETGEFQGPLMLNIYPATYLEFTRGGLNTTHKLPYTYATRVAYLVKNATLIRRTWNVLDRHPETKSLDQIILHQVHQFTVSILDHKNAWHTTWPMHGLKTVIPAAAIQYKVCIEHKGCLEFLVRVPNETVAA